MKTSGIVNALMVIAACGKMPAAPAVTPAAGSQPVTTAVPAAAGQGGELPADIPKPPPPARAEAAPAAPQMDTAAVAAGPRGTIVGQAWYAGPACAYASWPPQCNGAYREIWVWIWSHGGRTWLRAARTDGEGRYTFIVDPGTYTIMMETGFQDRWWFHKVDVAPFETTTANLVVDWGAR